MRRTTTTLIALALFAGSGCTHSARQAASGQSPQASGPSSSTLQAAKPIRFPSQCDPTTVAIVSGGRRTVVRSSDFAVTLHVGDQFHVTARGLCASEVTAQLASRSAAVRANAAGFRAVAHGVALIEVALPTCARASCAGGIGILTMMTARVV